MYWQTLNFGRYKNKTLPQFVLHDPDISSRGLRSEFLKIEVSICRLGTSTTEPVTSKFRGPMEKSGASIMTLSPVMMFSRVLGLCTAWLWKDSAIRLSGNRLVIWICQLLTAMIEMTRSQRSVCSEISNSSILGTRMRTYLGSSGTSFLNAMTILRAIMFVQSL